MTHLVADCCVCFFVLQIERMLNSPEALERLISTTPGLETDPVALCKYMHTCRCDLTNVIKPSL